MSLDSDNKIGTRSETILGSRCKSNYIFAGFLLIAGLYFFLGGLSSYFKINFIPFSDLKALFFIPQGITMLFYGTVAVSVSIFIWLTIFLDVGGGYNEYDNIEGKVTIFRKGFLGKNRSISFTYPISTIESIKLKSIGSFNTVPTIFLSLKDKREIPLIGSNSNLSINLIEEQAAYLAKYLNVYLEGI